MKIKLIASLLFISSFYTVYSQDKPVVSSWFSVKEVLPRVWVIDDHKAVNMYLVIGSDSAMLIDTGMGSADLLAQVRKLTHKPLIVVNTHGHPDHAGADFQFDKIYVHPADSAAVRACNLPESRVSAATNMLRGAVPQPGELYKGPEKHFNMVALKDGYTFNLGDHHIKVIETPGHTPGSICLLDKEYKILFTGDNDNTAVWLFLPTCSPLSVYYNTLQKLAARLTEFDTLLPGHGLPKKSEFILDQVECVKSILNHTCKSEPYDTFAGKAMLCKYGNAEVAYNPDNL
jgi:hydroxyacylglutathione hydrolase